MCHCRSLELLCSFTTISLEPQKCVTLHLCYTNYSTQLKIKMCAIFARSGCYWRCSLCIQLQVHFICTYKKLSSDLLPSTLCISIFAKIQLYWGRITCYSKEIKFNNLERKWTFSTLQLLNGFSTWKISSTD